MVVSCLCISGTKFFTSLLIILVLKLICAKILSPKEFAFNSNLLLSSAKTTNKYARLLGDVTIRS